MLALSEKKPYLCGNTLKLIDCMPVICGIRLSSPCHETFVCRSVAYE